MFNNSAVFAGNSSLLIHCAEAYRSAGHHVVAVISSDSKIVEWATAIGIGLILQDREPLVDVNVEFDFFFLVSGHPNSHPDLVARARVMALGFADSPSPKRAGPCEPSWAIINQQKIYGVCWYDMQLFGCGEIAVKQSFFDLAEDETTWSLHAKCYQAGLSTYVSLIEDVWQSVLSLPKAPAFKSNTGLLQQPLALSTLDFSQSARELVCLVSGLDFGPESNPIGLAKIYLGHAFAVVRHARLASARSLKAPGTVLRAAGDELEVATGDGDVVLGGISDAAGGRLAHVFFAGMVLQVPNEQLLELLDGRACDLARNEHYWRAAYHNVAPVDFPYPRITLEPSNSPRKIVRVTLPSTAPAIELVAAFFAWLSVLAAQQPVSLMYSDAALVEQVAPLDCWLSVWVPITVSMTATTTALQATAQMAVQIDRLHQAGPCTRDLPLRLNVTADTFRRLQKLGVGVEYEALPDGMDLMLAIDGSARGAVLVADDRVFSPAILTAIADHFAAYLAHFSGGGCIRELSLTTPEDVAATSVMNSAVAPCKTFSSVEELIAVQAQRTPDHAAVCFDGLSLSYSELESRAATLADCLSLRGIGPGHIVGLCLGRGVELMVCLLGIAKTGAAHLPLDPDYPRDRLLFMLEDSQTAFVVTTRVLAVTLDLPPDKTFLLDAPSDQDAACLEPAGDCLPAARLAYLMYTSGSTGKPKGVMVMQRNLLNLFAELDAMMAGDPPGRWLAIGSVCFDISVPELWWTLSRGFTVVIHQRTAHQWSVAQALTENEITHFFCTPSMASMLVADAAGRAALSRLSVLMVGGEALPLQLSKDLCGIVSGRVFNIYGPTETTVFATSCELSAAAEFVPLGRPIINTTLSVRTAWGAECPAWVPGELLIGGAGVANGYWRRAELTADRFVADPQQPGCTLYKTGDLVRRHPDGALEFLGRIDHQVKIRGHRIELGEIENVILQLPEVNEAVVLAASDKFGDSRLVAYVVPKLGKTLKPEQIQGAVASKLPAIMVPGIIMVLRAFALTPNGKVDRSALPPPKALFSGTAETLLPESSLEAKLVEVWEQALGMSPIKTTDNFFATGGCFFSGTNVQRYLLKSTGQFVQLADMVRFPTARRLAWHLDQVSQGRQDQPNLAGKEIIGLDPQIPADSAKSTLPEVTAVEVLVAEIWRDLFDKEHIARDDDFFHLGGNSLAAIRMFAQLRKQLPIELPLSTLFEASSLSGFCELVEKNQNLEYVANTHQPVQDALFGKKSFINRKWSPLVEICRANHQRPPLFCIHGAGGNVFNFKAISQKLGNEQTVYGLHPQGVDGHRPVLGSIEAMAEQYVNAIQSVDPHGPYQLIGYSAGGVIAFEMAQQLRKAGHQIALLAMIDTLTPAAAMNTPKPFKKLWLMRNWSLKFAIQRFRERHAGHALETSHVQALQRLASGAWLTPELVEPYLFRHIVTVQGRYKPASYNGPIVLYKASQATMQYLNAGKFLGWQAHIDGHIKIIGIPGSHNSMMQEPGLSDLGTALKIELDWLHAKAGSSGLLVPANQAADGLWSSKDGTVQVGG